MSTRARRCDDGNQVAGDGCSARCEIEAALTTTWTIRTVAGEPRACPAGFDAVVTSEQYVPCQTSTCTDVRGPRYEHTFACDAGTGTAMLPVAQYRTWTTLRSGSDLFATSIEVPVVVADQASVATDIITDGGYFTLRWSLPVTCGSVNNDVVRLVATRGSSAFSHDFDCQQFTPERFTDPMPAGTYDVMVSLESPEGHVGSTTIAGQVIAGPSKVTDLGTVAIPNH